NAASTRPIRPTNSQTSATREWLVSRASGEPFMKRHVPVHRQVGTGLAMGSLLIAGCLDAPSSPIRLIGNVLLDVNSCSTAPCPGGWTVGQWAAIKAAVDLIYDASISCGEMKRALSYWANNGLIRNHAVTGLDGDVSWTLGGTWYDGATQGRIL